MKSCVPFLISSVFGSRPWLAFVPHDIPPRRQLPIQPREAQWRGAESRQARRFRASDQPGQPCLQCHRLDKIPLHVPAEPAAAAEPKRPLSNLTEADLLIYGVPAEWIPDVCTANDDMLLVIASHLPVRQPKRSSTWPLAPHPPSRRKGSQTRAILRAPRCSAPLPGAHRHRRAG
jgi:hypothetical protein